MNKNMSLLSTLVENFSKISQHSNDDVYWLGDTDFKKCIYLNSAYENIFRYSREHVLKDLRVLLSYMIPQTRESYDPFLEMSRKIQQEGPLVMFNETYRIRRGDGRVRILVDHGHPIYDEHGKHIAFSGVVRDITLDLLRRQFPSCFFHQFPLSDKNKYYLKGRYQKIYLTAREAECAFYLLQGKTPKKIAKILQLSPRTIEDMLSHIKGKLGLHYLSDLFDALIEGDFIENFI